MNPQSGLIGDSYGTELPQKAPDTSQIEDAKKKAKYSRSKEYAELRAKAQTRIEFYRHFLPNGQPIGSVSREELAGKWELANILIAEFEQLFAENDNAERLLKEQYGEVLPS